MRCADLAAQFAPPLFLPSRRGARAYDFAAPSLARERAPSLLRALRCLRPLPVAVRIARAAGFLEDTVAP